MYLVFEIQSNKRKRAYDHFSSVSPVDIYIDKSNAKGRSFGYLTTTATLTFDSKMKSLRF